MTGSSNPHISHIITVMLENRSFDNILGFLYDHDDLPEHHIPPLKAGDPMYRGLNFVDPQQLKNWANVGGLVISGVPTHATRATNVPGYDPGETFVHVNRQLFGDPAGPKQPTQVPDMTGFLADYTNEVATHVAGIDFDTVRQIMGGYTPFDLPVTNTLAKKFAVCDEWFCSVPSQTNPNRAFSLAGTSCGLVDNGFLSPEGVPHALGDDKFQTRTVFNALSENGFDDWGVFWFEVYPIMPGNQYCYTRNLFPYLETIDDIDGHFHRFLDPIDGFLAKAAAGTLPRFTYIEPSWGGQVDYPGNSVVIMGNEMHPPTDMLPGEHLLRTIYDAVFSEMSAIADTALLVILFDEHGGTYDHVPPGPAMPPWGKGDPPPGTTLDQGFKFDRYGVRTPAILVSNGIRAGTVFRSATGTPFDHTSLPATVLKQFLPDLEPEHWGLGERTKIAPTFETVVTGDRSPAPPGASNVFTPETGPALGDPVHYGDPIWLKHESGHFVSFATHQRQHYPTLSAVAVTLGLHGDVGPVLKVDDVQIRTTEYLMPETMVSFGDVFPGIRNCLGAFESTSLYYDTPIDTNDDMRARQTWTLIAEAGGDPRLRYGDHVAFESAYPSKAGLRIARRDAALTLKTGKAELWQVLPGIRHQIATLRRLSAGERISVPADMFANLASSAGLIAPEQLQAFLDAAKAALAQEICWDTSGDKTDLHVDGGTLHVWQVGNAATGRASADLMSKVFAMMGTGETRAASSSDFRIRMNSLGEPMEMQFGNDAAPKVHLAFSLTHHTA